MEIAWRIRAELSGGASFDCPKFLWVSANPSAVVTTTPRAKVAGLSGPPQGRPYWWI